MNKKLIWGFVMVIALLLTVFLLLRQEKQPLAIEQVKEKYTSEHKEANSMIPIFNSQGRTVGWIEDNVIIDRSNRCRAFRS